MSNKWLINTSKFCPIYVQHIYHIFASNVWYMSNIYTLGSISVSAVHTSIHTVHTSLRPEQQNAAKSL